MAERALEHAASVDTVYDLLSSEYRGPALIDVNGAAHRPPDAACRRSIGWPASCAPLGLGPGDRIAIVLPNGPEMVFALLAAMAVGCAAPLNPKYREDEFRFYLDDLDAAALLTFEGSARRRRVRRRRTRTIVIDVRSDGGAVELVAPAGSTTAAATSRPARTRRSGVGAAHVGHDVAAEDRAAAAAQPRHARRATSPRRSS